MAEPASRAPIEADKRYTLTISRAELLAMKQAALHVGMDINRRMPDGEDKTKARASLLMFLGVIARAEAGG